MRFIFFLSILFSAGVQAQPVDGAQVITKRVFNLAPPEEEGAAPVGALRRTEYETYGPDGRRLRVEWRAPSGAVSLAFMELYGDTDRPFGAVYFEGSELSPTLEHNEYRETPDGHTVKRVTYINAEGDTTGANEFITDAQGREVQRRYGVSGGTARATDTIQYEGLNATGYVYERADGSRRAAYTFRNEVVDDRGNWTSRVTLRDGTPRLFETRDIIYAQR